jgi:hypothetical protein
VNVFDGFMRMILVISLGFVLIWSVLEHDHWLLFLFQSTSQVHSGQFAAGFVDASVRIFDVRTPDR